MTDAAWAVELWRDLLEKDDRTSPEEYPDMALIAQDEFLYCLGVAERAGLERAAQWLERRANDMRAKGPSLERWTAAELDKSADALRTLLPPAPEAI